MVGVPGRSKACCTCRSRNKGCDLKKPACGQCIKAGYVCGGYERQQIFVVSTPGSRRSQYSVQQLPLDALAGRKTRKSAVALPSRPTNLANSQELARSADESRSLDDFWEAYLPNGQTPPPGLFRTLTCTWTEIARQSYKDDDCLRYALWANCLGNMRRRGGMAWMEEEALRMYGKALIRLSASLRNPEKVKSDGLLAAIKLLGKFEVFFNHDKDESDRSCRAWERHSAGELALLIARKPNGHVRGDAHYIFADERLHLLLPAIKQRKRSILCTTEWKTIPWTEIPRNMKDMLIDVAVEMPGLLQDLDSWTICTDEDRRPILQKELIEQCWECDRQLFHWLRCLSVDRKFCDYAVPTTTDVPVSVAEFARLEGMSLLWATCLVLYSTLRLVYEPWCSLPAHTSLQQYAQKLVEAIPILTQPSTGFYGQEVAAIPLALALEVTRRTPSLSTEHIILVEHLGRSPETYSRGLNRIVDSVNY